MSRSREVRYYIVCLLDLLESRQRLQRWESLPSDDITEELIQALKDTVGVVNGFKRTFRDFFRQFDQFSLPSEQLSRLTPELREKFDRAAKSTPLSVQQFADTFVFYAPASNAHGDISGAAMFQMLTAAAMAMLVGLAAKSPLRGGISVGTGMEIAAKNFYGPSLTTVHRLESEFAHYPRIVLSQAAVDFLNFTSGFSQDPEIESVSARFHTRLRRLTCTDWDGRQIVDFMGEEIHSLASEVGNYVTAASDSFRFVRTALARFRDANDWKHTNRYALLLKYMQERVPIWGI